MSQLQITATKSAIVKKPLLTLIRGDSRTTAVKFKIQRYANGVDLKDLGWDVAVINANSKTDLYPLQIVSTDDEYITVRWLIYGVATAIVGDTYFELQGRSNNSSDQSVIWQSGKRYITITEDINAEPSGTTEQKSQLNELIVSLSNTLPTLQAQVQDVIDKNEQLGVELQNTLNEIDQKIQQYNSDISNLNSMVQLSTSNASTTTQNLANVNSIKSSIDNVKSQIDTQKSSIDSAVVAAQNSKEQAAASATTAQNAASTATTAMNTANSDVQAVKAIQITVNSELTEIRQIKTAVQTSQSNAKTSQIAANDSAADAYEYANNASKSASAAKTSQTNAKNSADSISGVQENVKNIQTDIATKHDQIKQDYTDITANKNAAALSATNAAKSQSNAATYASNANTASNNASTSATSAATSASNALTSQTNAKASQNAAKASQTAAAATVAESNALLEDTRDKLTTYQQTATNLVVVSTTEPDSDTNQLWIRDGSDDDGQIQVLTSSDLDGYATETYVNTKVSDLVNSAPQTLDTLKQLSDALNNDANFATTITNQISNKQDAISDIQTIRSGAALGATALQSVPSTYRTAEQQDAIHDSTKQDVLIAGTNISIADDGKTISSTIAYSVNSDGDLVITY